MLTTATSGVPMATSILQNTWQPNYTTATASQFIGFSAGQITYISGTAGGDILGSYDPLSITVVAEYSSPSTGTWQPYSLLARYDALMGNTNQPPIGAMDISRADPRTDRFTVSMGWGAVTRPGATYWPNATLNPAKEFYPSTTRGFVQIPPEGGSACSACLGTYSVNQVINTNGYTYYTDPDGVLRPGDAYRGNNNTGDGRPTFTSSGAPTDSPSAVGDNSNVLHGRRPIILNRPFQSVGELGYVFRDQPFKSLDFWSKDSADGALLDVFCVRENPATVVAGQVNPSSAPAPVLASILAGASKKTSDSTFNIISGGTNSDAFILGNTMANDLAAIGPLASRADVATKLGPVISGTSTTVVINGATVNVAFLTTGTNANVNWANKNYAEAPIRALADITNTRTWNLMIDVIAQTGEFKQNASDLNKDFVVSGERRYWLHIAIDRFTGKVIDTQLEPVYD
jgi:hypothetical protein